MKTTVETQTLLAARQRRIDLQNEISELAALVLTNGEQLTQLVADGDIREDGVLNEVARCQSLAALLPARIVSREERLAEAEASLLTECHQFISSQLGPRLRALRNKVERRTSQELGRHYPDELELARAVSNSATVRAVNDLAHPATISETPSGGLDLYVQRLLAAWSGCTELEPQS